MTDELANRVVLSRENHICTVTLNRPEKRNAADADMQRLILRRLQEVGNDPDTRVLILTGAGPSFCAGADRALLIAAGEGRLPEAAEIGEVQRAILQTIMEYPFPAIAAVGGAAAGFGAALATFCDFIVADETAVFWDPHVEVGLQAGLILQVLWPRMAPLPVIKEILMTGRRVGAAEALSLGLVNQVRPAGEALSGAMELAATFLNLPPTGIALMKRNLNRPVLAEINDMASRA